MRIANENLQTTPTDMSTSFNMSPVWLGHICNFSIQLFFTGSPTGTFKLQCSNDPGTPNSSNQQAVGVVNWTDVAGSSQGVVAGGDITWNVQNAGYNFVRVVYTSAGGTGTVTSARANVKGV